MDGAVVFLVLLGVVAACAVLALKGGVSSRSPGRRRAWDASSYGGTGSEGAGAGAGHHGGRGHHHDGDGGGWSGDSGGFGGGDGGGGGGGGE